jgi:glycosyltransferase involved in cell wall biosynthesis
MSAPSVSVIVPVFNKARYLAACLDSVLGQSLRNIEIICLDDASTDGSVEILARYADLDPRVKLISASTNRGPGPRRNLGIAAARSAYVQFTDADDVLPETALETLYRRAIDDQVAVVRGSVAAFESDFPEGLEVLVNASDKSAFDPLEDRSFWIPWWHHCYLISRDLLLHNQLGYPALRSGEDPVFLTSVLVAAERISTVPHVTYHYRLGDIAEKGRANIRHVQDFIEHARMVKDQFGATRPECWTDGYRLHIKQDIEKFIQRCPLSALERERVNAQVADVFGTGPSGPSRILFVYRLCGLGGVETSILNKMQALRRHNASVEVLFLAFWGEGGQSIAKRSGVHVISERAKQLELLRQHWDVVILVDTPEFLEVLTEADVRCPVLFETHASYAPSLDHFHSRMGDPLISAVIAPSGFNKRLLMAGGCDEDSIHVIPNAIDAAVFGPAPHRGSSDIDGLPVDVPLVLSVGRLEPQKNTFEFVRIACALLAEGNDAHFVIVGDFVDTAQYAVEVRAAALSQSKDHFTFIPRIEYEDMRQLYSRAAKSGGCLVVSSLNESQPMTILEAMVCRCPVVAANVGGTEEVVFESVTGRLYDSGNVPAARSAVKQFLEDEGFRERVVEQAWAYVHIEHAHKGTAALYASLIKKSRSNKSPRLLTHGDELFGEFVALPSDMPSSENGGPSLRTAKAVFFGSSLWSPEPHAKLAIAFVTIERPHAAQRLILSARRFLGDLPIYVADQSATIDTMSAFYERNQVNVIRMPFDSGLAASRNALVREIKENFFLLCDDDFVLGPCSNVDDAMTVLENATDLAVVGGRLHDYHDGCEHVRNWEMYFQYDRHNRSFTAIPIYNYSPQVRSVAGIDVYLCDAVMNFCVFRKSVFSDCIRWDDRIKINGEHEDFFLNLKLNSQWKVAYLPSMAALHHRSIAAGSYQSALRSRQEGWTYFLEKWGIDQHLEIGTGVRALEPSTQRWFVEPIAPKASEKARICEVMPGQTPMLPEAGIAFMRLRSLLPERGDTSPPWVTAHSSLRSLLDPEDDVIPYDATAPFLRFCYSQGERGSNLLLWCRPEKTTGASQGKKRSWFASAEGKSVVRTRAALRFKWFGDQGKSLVGEGERIEVELYDEGYWRPIVARIPLWPADAGYLRFEIVAEKGEERVPLAIGFLFAEASGRSNESKGDVMVLSVPRPAEASLPGLNRPPFQRSTDRGTSTRVLELTRDDSPYKAEIDLTQTELLDVKTLIFLDWKCTGGSLAMVDTFQAAFQLASRIQLPPPPCEGYQTLGILKSGECCRFELNM